MHRQNRVMVTEPRFPTVQSPARQPVSWTSWFAPPHPLHPFNSCHDPHEHWASAQRTCDNGRRGLQAVDTSPAGLGGRGTGRRVQQLETHLHEAPSPLQPAEACEDLVPLVLHLPVDAHDLCALHQRLQGLAVVLHAGAGAAGGTEGVVAGHLPCCGRRGEAVSTDSDDPILWETRRWL